MEEYYIAYVILFLADTFNFIIEAFMWQLCRKLLPVAADRVNWESPRLMELKPWYNFSPKKTNEAVFWWFFFFFLRQLALSTYCQETGNCFLIIWKDCFPGGLDSKESACSAGDTGSIPGSGRSPEEGNGYPLQYSCLENPMDRGAWWATVHGVTKSQTWLATNTIWKEWRSERRWDWNAIISVHNWREKLTKVLIWPCKSTYIYKRS